MVDWKWMADRGGVEVDGKPYRFVRGTLDELQEFAEVYEEARWVVATLNETLAAFRLGQADLSDAAAQLRHLRRQLGIAGTEITAAADQVGQFFDPPTVGEAFADALGKEFDRFIREAVVRLGAIAVDAGTGTEPQQDAAEKEKPTDRPDPQPMIPEEFGPGYEVEALHGARMEADS